MNIYDLRKAVHVSDYWLHSTGAYFKYASFTTRESVINISRDVLLKELIAIGSLDDTITDEQFLGYELSQWDALNIVIRFELARETEKEIENGDIGKAIKNLINK